MTTPAPVVPNPLVNPDDSPGVKERIDRALAAQRAAEAAAATAAAQVAELQTRVTRAERNAVLVAANVKTPSVQRALGRDYDDYAAQLGDKAVDFGTWIETEAKTDPLFAPHFVSAAPVAPVAAAAPANPAAPAPVVTPPAAPVPTPTPGNPNGGTVPVVVQQGKVFTDEETKGWDDATAALHAPALREQLARGDGGVKVILPPSRKRTP